MKNVHFPGKSFGLKFIPKSVFERIRTHPSQSEKSFQSHSM